jgi:hypothetical protein
MTEPSGESKATETFAHPRMHDKAADGLQMAELSRRALLAADPSKPESTAAPQVSTSVVLPGADPALLDPLSSLPPHVTRAAAARSFSPAVHKVDKPGHQE